MSDPGAPTPYQRFAWTVEAHPAQPAIDDGESCLSYRQLDELVAAAAGHLAGLDLPPQSRIGLVVPRRLATYVCYLAILRIGHVVVPLAPDNPIAFQQTVVDLAGVGAVILDESTDVALGAVLRTLRRPVLDATKCLTSVRPAPPTTPAAGDDLTYVLFTSGSTGRAKGVGISNANVAAYLDRVVPACGLGPGARLSQTFALTFDPSVFDLFGAWSSGATLVIPRGRELLAPAHYVNARQLTHWYSVPSLISYARRIGNLRPGAMPGLRRSMFIGEPLPVESAEDWRAAAPASTVVNVYGPTELTVSCAEYVLPDDVAEWPRTANATVPIGHIYSDLDWMLWNPEDEAADEGELCVRGPQRFGGYLDPTDNAGRFLHRSGVDGATHVTRDAEVTADDWYRTGDRVRIQDGLLLHLGRVDRQVKIRGHRIELGYLEAVLRRHPAVDEAAVLVLPDARGALEIHAVVCGDQSAAADLLDLLRTTVPPYMVPTGVSWFTELPHNRSGKVDYVALRGLLTEE